MRSDCRRGRSIPGKHLRGRRAKKSVGACVYRGLEGSSDTPSAQREIFARGEDKVLVGSNDRQIHRSSVAR